LAQEVAQELAQVQELGQKLVQQELLQWWAERQVRMELAMVLAMHSA